MTFSYCVCPVAAARDEKQVGQDTAGKCQSNLTDVGRDLR